jgi:nicotinamidase-related amidase
MILTSPVAITDADRVALLLLDFQQGVLDTIEDSDDVVSRAAVALSWARCHGVHVAHVRVAFSTADFEAVPAHNKAIAPVVQNRFFADESPEDAIHARLAPRDGELVVRKTRFGALSTTELHAEFQERRIGTLILAGVTTSGAVLSTVRDAVDRDYEVYVLTDAVADPDAETQTYLLERLFPQSISMIHTGNLPTYAGDELGAALPSHAS